MERTTAELDLQIALGQVLTVTSRARSSGGGEHLCPCGRSSVNRSVRYHSVSPSCGGCAESWKGEGNPRRPNHSWKNSSDWRRKQRDAALLIEGHVALGVCSFYRGDMSTAHSHLQAGLAVYDAQRPQTYIFPAGQDLGILALVYDAMALWVLGYPQQALERSCRALRLAEDVAQPWAQAMALGYAAVMCVWRGERQAAFERAEATIKLATEQDVSAWIGRGMMLRGWALAEQGQEEEGLGQILQGLATGRPTVRNWASPFGWPCWERAMRERHRSSRDSG